MLTYSVERMDEEVRTPTGGSPRAAHPVVRWAIALGLLAVLFMAVLVARGWRPGSDGGGKAVIVAGTPVMPTSPAIEAMYGIRFTGVDVTAGGGMIQVRYQVLDSAKTEAIHDEAVAPYVIDSRRRQVRRSGHGRPQPRGSSQGGRNAPTTSFWPTRWVASSTARSSPSRSAISSCTTYRCSD